MRVVLPAPRKPEIMSIFVIAIKSFYKISEPDLSQFHPDRILIEPSGVGKLSDVIVAVENTVSDVPELRLNSFVTVVDAAKVGDNVDFCHSDQVLL